MCNFVSVWSFGGANAKHKLPRKESSSSTLSGNANDAVPLLPAATISVRRDEITTYVTINYSRLEFLSVAVSLSRLHRRLHSDFSLALLAGMVRNRLRWHANSSEVFFEGLGLL